MAYTNRTIRLAFDGTDDRFPNLGDDIFVIIANPMLMPPSKLRGKTDVETDANGRPTDPDAAMRASMEICAGLILDWCVYDPMDFSEDVKPFPTPVTGEMMEQAPTAITNAIGEILGKALNPQ